MRLGFGPVQPCSAAGTQLDNFGGNLVTPRTAHTATLLAGGQVLLAGGYSSTQSAALNAAELYDPATNTWTATASLNDARYYHGAVRLTDGRVLAVGGQIPMNYDVPTAEIYDPATGTWTHTASPSVAHSVFDPVLLPNGKVLVAGGLSYANGGAIATAELYNPSTGTWSLTGSLVHGRTDYRAVLLASGKVLITGGNYFGTYVPQAEIYDPATGTFSDTGSLNIPRDDHVAVLLKNGRVLIAGGIRSSGGKLQVLAAAEIYDPATGLWTLTGSLTTRRSLLTANLLTDGRVLAAGGYDNSFQALDSIEEYSPVSGQWRLLRPTLTTARFQHTTTALLDGSLIVAGGYDQAREQIPTAELFVRPR